MPTGKPTIAQQWLEKIDKPNRREVRDRSIDKRAVEQMTDNAADAQEYGASYVYIFDDGSSLYEKRRDDWYSGGGYIRCPECEVWHSENKPLRILRRSGSKGRSAESSIEGLRTGKITNRGRRLAN